jgi:putative FmdB family regulatory protein
MPLYEYECNQCGDRFERLVALREAKKAMKCPKCGSESVNKLMSAIASVSRREGGASECPSCNTGMCDL